MEQFTPLTGGWSTDTSRLQGTLETTEGEGLLDVVVRRIPPDGLLAPYDVEREYRTLIALQDSPLPVPAVYGCDAAGEHLGDPCLVTEFVQGEPLSFFGQSTDSGDLRLRSYHTALATIHTLDWAAYGLQFLDEAEDPLEAELHRTEVRLKLYDSAGQVEQAMLDWLRGHKPPSTTKALLHGDPNPANYLFTNSRVTAVLDWELALVGDPRIDFGFFAAVQATFAETWQLDITAFLEGYAAANPAANLQHVDYFEAIGLFRMTAFLHAAKVRKGMDVTELWRRLEKRFERIAYQR